MVSPEVYENTKSLPVPLMRSSGGGMACASKSSCQDGISTKTTSRDYSELSKKLQIRLQFAYYKYKTKQTDKISQT
ncbi:AIF_collapsed_G0031560.mRNA.1.CDS.1 [Saccharomyces cerevisiae]|nr:AIF_collapsed_G0031560.mRNA.1.CDS.1 [Saccharomyces cerevisiae]